MSAYLGLGSAEPSDTDRRRFVRRMPALDPNRCWELQGKPVNGGYKRIRINGQIAYAHRAAWRLMKGPIPDGLDVLHHCDNPSCVRPDHLFLGDALANVRDAVAKGRMPRFVASLSVDQVAQIRGSGWRPEALAVRFGVSVRTVYRALRPGYNARGTRAESAA